MSWVSVKDAMPIKPEDFDTYHEVEVIVFDGESVSTRWCAAGKVPDFWCSFDVGDITHWMSVPEGPNK